MFGNKETAKISAPHEAGWASRRREKFLLLSGIGPAPLCSTERHSH